MMSNQKYPHLCHMCGEKVFSEFQHCDKCNSKRLGKIGLKDPCMSCRLAFQQAQIIPIEVRAF